MNFIKFILFFQLFISMGCQNEIILKENIKIVKSEKHPFLVDHNKLIVVEKDGKIIDEISGYTDTGRGCNSNLFEDEHKFIVIECNGTIYNIRKKVEG